MKKLIVAMSLLLMIAKVGYGYNSVLPYTIDSGCVLQSGTTAAFSVYLTSVSTTGTTTGRFTRYASSLTLEQLNSGGGATTNYFDVLLSTSDAIFDIVNRINEITNWTATISAGCYGLQYATGSASVRVDSEGTTDGLQYDATGKSVSFSTGSANAITIYQNATQYLSTYLPVRNGVYNVVQTAVSLAQGTTMYLYEGASDTTTTTELTIPKSDVNEVNYSEFAPIKTVDNYAAEFRIMTGTWTVCTGDNKLQSQIFYFKRD